MKATCSSSSTSGGLSNCRINESNRGPQASEAVVMDRMNTDIAQMQTMSSMPSIPLGTLAEFDHTPRVRIVFGPGASMRAGQLARDLGGRRVLLVTDPGI